MSGRPYARMMQGYAAPNRNVLVATFGGNLFGVNRHTGRLLWQVSLEILFGEEVADLHVGDEVSIAVTFSKLHFVATLTGQLLARVPLSANDAVRPTSLVDDSHLYVATSGEIECFTLHGERVWRQPFSGKGTGSVALGFPGNVRQADK